MGEHLQLTIAILAFITALVGLIAALIGHFKLKAMPEKLKAEVLADAKLAAALLLADAVLAAAKIKADAKVQSS
jgi:hypothetical protein